jgi:hypothetical protein
VVGIYKVVTKKAASVDSRCSKSNNYISLKKIHPYIPLLLECSTNTVFQRIEIDWKMYALMVLKSNWWELSYDQLRSRVLIRWYSSLYWQISVTLPQTHKTFTINFFRFNSNIFSFLFHLYILGCSNYLHVLLIWYF